jgi:hypothetical protein
MRNNHIWIDVLADLVKNYNTTPHRSLSKFFGTATSPEQMTEKKDNEIMESDLKKVDWVRSQTRDLVGKSVRILMSRTNFGTKSEKTVKSNDQTWSSEIYQVLEREGPNSYRLNTTGLDPRIWPVHSLLVVDGQNTTSQPPKNSTTSVNRAAVSAQRMENQNISPEERAEALAGPKDSKRITKLPSRFA